MIRIILITLVLFTTQLFAQPTQTIRGTITDNASNLPIAFAGVELLNTNPLIGISTDTLGNFSLINVPVGRYDVKVTCIGYEPAIVREIVVISAKQTFLTISLKENISLLKEIVVKPHVSKELPLNSMATVSARMLSVEEAKRYAGGFDDPARLASSFAGVASNNGENGIIVRGNAPKFLQWKMEGIEIPNPNHFGDLRSIGGGTFTALSSQMLANSDFMTGAFPSEYNNALSGVFDIAMRKGNNEKREHTFQVGVVGIDASSEGPFKKGGKASYLFNYRYSTLALLTPLLPEGANSLKYQDLSFKLNFPTQKAGTFALWGIGLIDRAGAKAKTDSTKWAYIDDRSDNDIKQYMGAVGLSHKYFLKNNRNLKTTLAATVSGIDWTTERLDQNLKLQPQSKISNTNWDFVLSSILTRKVNAKYTKKTGILVTGKMYDILLNKSLTQGSLPKEIVNATGFGAVVSGFSSASFNVTDKLLVNVGINNQFTTLNKHITIEPRFGMRQQMGVKQSIGFAYGMHSRLEKLNYYFNNSLSTGETNVNKDLDFTKAHHFVLSYDLNISDLVHFKAEPYYQHLYSVPVIANTSFSFLNLRNDLFFAEKLQNTGKGRNYGIDLTLEKYLSKGFYYLLTGSVFNSEYQGGDGIWRNTRFNRNYGGNFLVGKEWALGRNKQNILSVNTRLNYQGGNRFSPVNEAETHAAQDIVFDETKAFSVQSPSTLNVHFTASYKINKKNTSQEWALKILNVTGQSDFDGFKYNSKNKSIDKDVTSIVIPNLSYKIEF